jgi:hypothetical protein
VSHRHLTEFCGRRSPGWELSQRAGAKLTVCFSPTAQGYILQLNTSETNGSIDPVSLGYRIMCVIAGV